MGSRGFAATPPEIRVWKRVEKRSEDECWPWTGTKNKGGYGLIVYGDMHNRRSTTAHRVVWASANGRWPDDGLVILHACDNPGCCNPKHLSIGTHKDNADDCAAKGRRPDQRGIKRQFGGRIRKMTDEMVVELRRLAKEDGKRDWELAVIFDISEGHASAIRRRLRKVHVF